MITTTKVSTDALISGLRAVSPYRPDKATLHGSLGLHVHINYDGSILLAATDRYTIGVTLVPPHGTTLTSTNSINDETTALAIDHEAFTRTERGGLFATPVNPVTELRRITRKQQPVKVRVEIDKITITGAQGSLMWPRHTDQPNSGAQIAKVITGNGYGTTDQIDAGKPIFHGLNAKHLARLESMADDSPTHRVTAHVLPNAPHAPKAALWVFTAPGQPTPRLVGIMALADPAEPSDTD